MAKCLIESSLLLIPVLTIAEPLAHIKMKLLYLILICTVSTMSFSQDSLQSDFDEFRIDLEEYESALDSNEMIIPALCENYILKWKVNIANNSGWNIGIKGDLGDLCSDIEQYDKVNKKTLKKKNSYGMTYYTYRYIGNKYVKVTGTRGTGSINETIFYYEINE